MKFMEYRRLLRFAQMFPEPIFFEHAEPDRRDDEREDERDRGEDEHPDRFGDDRVHHLKFAVNQLYNVSVFANRVPSSVPSTTTTIGCPS